MSRLDPIAGHPLLDGLNELAELAQSIEVTEAEEEHERATVDWLCLAPARLATGLREADPLLFSQTILSDNAVRCTRAVDSIRLYIEGREPVALTAAETEMEAVLATFGPLVRLGSEQALEATQETMDLLARRNADALAAMEQRVAEADARAADALARLADRDAEITQALALLDQRTQDVGVRLTAEQARVDEIAAKAQQSLSDQLAEIRAAGVADQERQESEFAQMVEALEAAAQASQASLGDSASTLIAVINEHEEKARRAVSTIGEHALAGGFGAHADAQRKEADHLRTVTLWLSSGGVAAAILLILIHVSGSNDLGQTLTLLGASAGLGGVAAYTGRQSAIHRHAEQTSRKIALELEALPAFLVELDADAQNEIRKQIIDRLIIHPQPLDADPSLVALEDSPSTIAAITQLVKSIKA